MPLFAEPPKWIRDLEETEALLPEKPDRKSDEEDKQNYLKRIAKLREKIKNG